MAAGDIKLVYGTDSALTITLASLPSDTNLLAGQEATAFDNTSGLNLDALVGGKITTGTGPTTGRRIEIWAVAQFNNTPTYPDVFDGTNSAETVSSRDILFACARLVASITTDANSDRTYYFGPTSLAGLFGGVLPPRVSLFVVHNTGVNLNATAGNHEINVKPVYANVAA